MKSYRVLKVLAGSSLLALTAAAAEAQTAPPADAPAGDPPAAATSQPATGTGQPAVGTPSQQQNAGGGGAVSGDLNGDIVVQARRQSEMLQDVPLTVNAVTAGELAKVNIRRFEDVSSLVPGLTLATNFNGQGTTSTLRGINFDANVSGTNPSVEYYLNDAIIGAGAIFQAVYDIGQIEVLRGPQGTLRGRASPSGSITVTTHRPDLNEIGGYVQMTGTNIGAINANAALNLPIIHDVLALRLAGVVDENDFSRVRSINNLSRPYSRTWSGRAQLRFEPTDTISLIGTYQHTKDSFQSYNQEESANLVDPTAAPSPVTITPRDRSSVEVVPRHTTQTQTIYNLQASWAFAGQRLNYVGAYNKQPTLSFLPNDTFGLFGNNFQPQVVNAHQDADTKNSQQSHELRLSSDQRLLGLFDYTAGLFYIKDNTPVSVLQQTAVFFGDPPTPGNLILLPGVLPTGIVNTPISTDNRSIEKSAFGHVTLHIGDKTELAGGGRYISYRGTESLIVNGASLFDVADKFHHFVYSGSATHRFTDDLMVYANYGTSWRPGLHVIGDFSIGQSGREREFTNLPPETSKSIEVGFKSSWLDHRVILNIDGYHQTFQNYPFRASSPQFYISTDAGVGGAVQTVKTFNFASPVPVTVNGVELEASFKASKNWTVGLTSSYAKSHIKNGRIPCNDYGGAVPTIADINAVAGPGNNVAQCTAGYSAGLSPDFVATLQSEYNHPLTDHVNVFLRGLLNFYGKSKNDAANPRDDVSSYELLNLYTGIRDPKGAWEVNLFAKNITNTLRVLTRGSTPGTTTYQVLASGKTFTSSYYGITTTQPREFGINLRYAFGSH